MNNLQRIYKIDIMLKNRPMTIQELTNIIRQRQIEMINGTILYCGLDITTKTGSYSAYSGMKSSLSVEEAQKLIWGEDD